jgi:hypothetical protein
MSPARPGSTRVSAAPAIGQMLRRAAAPYVAGCLDWLAEEAHLRFCRLRAVHRELPCPDAMRWDEIHDLAFERFGEWIRLIDAADVSDAISVCDGWPPARRVALLENWGILRQLHLVVCFSGHAVDAGSLILDSMEQTPPASSPGKV